MLGSRSWYSCPNDWRVCNFCRRSHFLLSLFVSSKVWRFQFFLLFRVSPVSRWWLPLRRVRFSIAAVYRSTADTLVAAGCSGFSVRLENSLSNSRLSNPLPSAGKFLVSGDLFWMRRHMSNRTTRLAKWDTSTVLVLQVSVLWPQLFCGGGIAI